MKADPIHSRAYEVAAWSELRVWLAELMPPINAETQLTAAGWKLELDRCALLDVRKLFDSHGNPIDIPNLGDDEAACIAGFEVVEECSGKGDRVPVPHIRKFKLVDKLRALELPGKTRGCHPEKHKVEGEFTLKALVLAMMEKEQKLMTTLPSFTKCDPLRAI